MTVLPWKFELKALSDEGVIEGIASNHEVDQGGDKVLPGAFAKSIAAQPKGVPMLWQHKAEEPIGIWQALTENARGLHVKGRLILTVAKAREAFDLLSAGVVSGLSIGFETKQATRDRNTGVRLLKEILLREVSLVTFPMNDAARVISVKAGEIDDKRDYENFLREAGFSRERAKILSKGFVPAKDVQREAERTEVLNLASSIRERAAKLGT